MDWRAPNASSRSMISIPAPRVVAHPKYIIGRPASGPRDECCEPEKRLYKWRALAEDCLIEAPIWRKIQYQLKAWVRAPGAALVPGE